jgi:para-nitrobenzyl esterase
MRIDARRLAILAFLGATCAGAFAADMRVTDVQINDGALRGLAMPDGSSVFYAIPYAASPVGSLRWRPAQPVAPWQGTRDATHPPAPCIQHDEGWNKADAAIGKEDCLYLSIRTPRHGAKNRLPVYFWIHGGSNSAGDGYGYVSTTAMTQRGVLLVAIEYRLGVFGFLGLPALSAESPQHASGNYALTDMIAALKWVHANIARFGGDPGNVTIGGQSAGSWDVIQLTTSPLAAGLFQKAILESGAPAAPVRTAVENENVGSGLFELLHLSGLEVLRAARADEVLAASDKLQTPPGIDRSLLWGQQIVDGWVEPLPIRTVYAAHKQAHVPMIIGNNTREFPVELPPDTQRHAIHTLAGARTDALLKLYGLDTAEAPKPDPILGSVSTQLITDMIFRCPANRVAQEMMSAGVKVWRYQFGLPVPGTTGPAEHSSELKYVFEAAPPNATVTTWPPVQQYWVNFIRTGNPNGPGLPDWPDMGTTKNYMSFTPSGPELGQNLRGAICDIIEGERSASGQRTLQ